MSNNQEYNGNNFDRLFTNYQEREEYENSFNENYINENSNSNCN